MSTLRTDTLQTLDSSFSIDVADLASSQGLGNIADPTAGAARIGRAIRWIASKSELSSLAGQYNGEIVYLRGSSGIESAGSGEFVFNSSSVLSPDTGTVFGSGTGRWHRKITGHVIEGSWFDMNSADADSTAKVQAAINAASTFGLKRIRLPGTGYYKVGALTGTTGITFEGDGAFFEGFAYNVVQDPKPKPEQIVLPAAYSWVPGKIYSNGVPGQVKHTIDVEKMWLDNEVQGTVVYYVSPTGNDANTGTGINAPLKNLPTAIAKADVGIIKMFPGTYYNNTSIGTAIGVSVNRDIEISSLSGGPDVILRTGPDPATLTWTLNTGSTYETTPGMSIGQVFDVNVKDENGDPYRLVARTSIALVNANPGSFFYDPGTLKVYVRTAAGTNPSSTVILLGIAEGTVTGNRALFMKNIRVEGGGIGLLDNTVAVPRLYMVDSSVKYGANNGIRTLAGYAYLQRVTVALSGLDNMNYHDNGALKSRALEIDCFSYGSGYLLAGSVSESNNASSMHDDGVVLRINGIYTDSWGPVIPDTGTSTSWNIGVSAFKSLAPTASQNNAYYTETGMTLIDCQSSGCVYDLRVGTGGTMNLRNVETNQVNLLEGTGKLRQI
jgi:hypothetical protein